MMRAGFAVLAILCALVIGRLTVPEPPPRVQIVKQPIFVTAPPAPAPKPAPRRRATLEDVRRDWGIEGRLSCFVVQR